MQLHQQCIPRLVFFIQRRPVHSYSFLLFFYFIRANISKTTFYQVIKCFNACFQTVFQTIQGKMEKQVKSNIVMKRSTLRSVFLQSSLIQIAIKPHYSEKNSRAPGLTFLQLSRSGSGYKSLFEGLSLLPVLWVGKGAEAVLVGQTHAMYVQKCWQCSRVGSSLGVEMSFFPGFFKEKLSIHSAVPKHSLSCLDYQEQHGHRWAAKEDFGAV